MLFKTNEESLEIEVAGYEFPEGVGEDADWLVLKGTYKADGTVTKDRSSCLTAGELQELTAGLKVLKAGIRDHYVSDFQEDAYFSLSARAEGDRFRFHVSFYLPNTMDGDDTAELTGSMTSEELGALIDELDRLCEKFPDRT